MAVLAAVAVEVEAPQEQEHQDKETMAALVEITLLILQQAAAAGLQP
jgi:hypothetical protein